jgi:hypothetical protein
MRVQRAIGFVFDGELAGMGAVAHQADVTHLLSRRRAAMTKAQIDTRRPLICSDDSLGDDAACWLPPYLLCGSGVSV